MSDEDSLARQFEAHRTHLRAVAIRMLGSGADADDALQEAWLRLSRSDTSDIANLTGWLTTVVGRVCLDVLRARRSRSEVSLDDPDPPEPALPRAAAGPEHEAALADSVGVAMLVVLDTLAPAERLAFLLHDMFEVPFDEIAPIVDRAPAATRQLASRARRRVQGATPAPADLSRRRQVVDAFLAAPREGRFDDLLALLDPEVRLHADDAAVASARLGAVAGAPSLERELRGARAVASAFSGRARAARPALVDGMPGAAWAPDGVPRSVVVFTIDNGRVAGIDVVVDPGEIAALDVVLVED
jgi:RNA polymerase sigma-70 factor (ECF subfamily)